MSVYFYVSSFVCALAGSQVVHCFFKPLAVSVTVS